VSTNDSTYEHYLRLAEREDFTQLEAMRFCYRAGTAAKPRELHSIPLDMKPLDLMIDDRSLSYIRWFTHDTGVDNEGRQVIVAIANNLVTKSINFDLLLLYAIKFMDPIVSQDYVLVCVSANVPTESRPSMAWIKKTYAVFNRKYVSSILSLSLSLSLSLAGYLLVESANYRER